MPRNWLWFWYHLQHARRSQKQRLKLLSWAWYILQMWVIKAVITARVNTPDYVLIGATSSVDVCWYSPMKNEVQGGTMACSPSWKKNRSSLAFRWNIGATSSLLIFILHVNNDLTLRHLHNSRLCFHTVWGSRRQYNATIQYLRQKQSLFVNLIQPFPDELNCWLTSKSSVPRGAWISVFSYTIKVFLLIAPGMTSAFLGVTKTWSPIALTAAFGALLRVTVVTFSSRGAGACFFTHAGLIFCHRLRGVDQKATTNAWHQEILSPWDLLAFITFGCI